MNATCPVCASSVSGWVESDERGLVYTCRTCTYSWASASPLVLEVARLEAKIVELNLQVLSDFSQHSDAMARLAAERDYHERRAAGLEQELIIERSKRSKS